MLKILRTGLMVVGGVAIVWSAIGFIWPLIDRQGVVEAGGYRELEIGDSKLDVMLLNSNTRSRLKIAAFQGDDGSTVTILSSDACAKQLTESDRWYLMYPGVHQEIITVDFANDRIAQIAYRRDILSP
jgi:hypothetical protein